MRETPKPRPLAVIREQECIGCAKCIQACPVDAILGSAKQMHTVIADECIGCKLCLPPCPVDCIDLITPLDLTPEPNPEVRKQKAVYIKKRVSNRQKRLETLINIQDEIRLDTSRQESKAYVNLALERIRAKKNKNNNEGN